MTDEQRAGAVEVARVLAKCDGFQDPQPQHTEWASRVYTYSIAPLVADARWLIAELQHKLESERLAHAITKARLEEADQRLTLMPKADCGGTETHPAHTFDGTGPHARLWCSGVLRVDAVNVEADRMRREIEFEANAITMVDRPPAGHRPVDSDRCQCGETMHTTRDWFDHWRLFVLCACPPDAEEAAALVAAGFSPIRCAMHPAGVAPRPGHLNVRDLLCECAICQRHGLPTDAMRAEYADYRAAAECDGTSTCPASTHVDDCAGEALQARWCDAHGQQWLTCSDCAASDGSAR